MQAYAAARRLQTDLSIDLWLAYLSLLGRVGHELERESANFRLGVGIAALGAAESLHALPVLGGASARVLLGTMFFSAYAGWTSLPAMHRLYASVAAAFSVPSGDAYSVVRVQSDGMAPAIPEGAFAVVDFSAYARRAPRVGDVVAVAVGANRVYIKRLVAMPGDSFQVNGLGVLTNGRRPPGWRNRALPNYELNVEQDTFVVNGVPIDRSIADVPIPAQWSEASRLPEDCYVVLGDNVNDSEDSHVFGCVPRAAIVGRVLRVL